MERNSLIAYTLVALAMVNLQKSCHLLGVEGGDTLRLGDSLRGNQTILSKNGTFVLGFFSPDGTTNRYIGIWYANISERTIVWVANRENPVRNSAGVLKVSGGFGSVFKYKLGSGGFGSVFKGTLTDTTLVAVKNS